MPIIAAIDEETGREVLLDHDAASCPCIWCDTARILAAIREQASRAAAARAETIRRIRVAAAERRRGGEA